MGDVAIIWRPGRGAPKFNGIGELRPYVVEEQHQDAVTTDNLPALVRLYADTSPEGRSGCAAKVTDAILKQGLEAGEMRRLLLLGLDIVFQQKFCLPADLLLGHRQAQQLASWFLSPPEKPGGFK